MSYESLRRQVLRRDSWRCQSCGAMSNLEVHHKQFRSQSGEDSELNLITLCTGCHTQDGAQQVVTADSLHNKKSVQTRQLRGKESRNYSHRDWANVVESLIATKPEMRSRK